MALNFGFSSVINFPGNHTHVKPEQQIEETVFKEVLASVENDPTRRLREIYDETLQASLSEIIPNYSKIRCSMSGARTRTLPSILENCQDIEIEGDCSNTNLLLHLDRDMGVAIFCTDYALQYLSRSTVIFAMKILKTHHTLLISLFCMPHWETSKCQLFFSLLTAISELQYGFLFLMIRAKLLENFQADSRPQIVITDYESGLISSIRSYLPNSYHFVCFFLSYSVHIQKSARSGTSHCI